MADKFIKDIKDDESFNLIGHSYFKPGHFTAYHLELDVMCEIKDILKKNNCTLIINKNEGEPYVVVVSDDIRVN